jgi:hypothetical protein
MLNETSAKSYQTNRTGLIYDPLMLDFYCEWDPQYPEVLNYYCYYLFSYCVF